MISSVKQWATWRAYRAAFVAAAATLTASCAGRQRAETVGPVVYPPPPDTARIQYLTSISSELDIGRSRSALDRFLGTKTGIKGIVKPYGLAVHRNRLLVCDEDNFGVDIVDLDRATITIFRPTDPQGLRRPVNCFVDRDGTLYVTDLGSNRVAVYDSSLAFRGFFGDEDDGQPADVFVAGERVYVSSLAGSRRIRVYDRATRQLLHAFPDAPPGDSTGLAAPANLFVAGDTVYVSDLLKQRVLVYTTDGRYLGAIGRPGMGPATFQRPKGVARDRDGLVYVVDAAFENVQVFSPQGRLLMFFGGPGSGPGAMLLPAKVVLDYDHLDRFRQYVQPGAELKYLIFVTNQFGASKVAVYGFIGPSDYVVSAAGR